VARLRLGLNLGEEPRKFLDLQQVLFLYALVHECFEGVIEGDEA